MVTHSARDGRNLTIGALATGVTQGYNLSSPVAYTLSFAAFLILGKLPIGRVSLHDLARHGKLEHDASLVHRDAGEGEEYAPVHVDMELLRDLVSSAEGEGRMMTVEDFVCARVRRERASEAAGAKKLGWFHEAVSCREIAALVEVFGREGANDSGVGLPVGWLREWMGMERLPEGWTRPVRAVNPERRAWEVIRLLKAQRQMASKGEVVVGATVGGDSGEGPSRV